MAKGKQTAKALLNKYRNGQCTEDEKALLESWYREWHADLNVLDENNLSMAEHEMWNAIRRRNEKRIRRVFRIKWAAVASIILSLSFIGYHFYSPKARSITSEAQAYVQDVDPGSNKALLTLTDGTKIDLNTLQVGESITQKGLKISKNAAGDLVYEAANPANKTADEAGATIAYNEVTTPQGGEFQLILPDGTKVWLNASSTIRYPLTFAENERKVELEGEAYFEVAKRKMESTKQQATPQPFTVNTPYQRVEVLGTHFNVNAYDNENETKTTLIEGSVKVSTKNGSEQILKPNEQGITKGADRILVHAVNPAVAIAWKEGQFLFDNTDLKTIMRQLERWYNIKVVDLEHFPNSTYNGKLKRTSKLSKVLQILELTSDLKFKIVVPPDGEQERRLILLE